MTRSVAAAAVAAALPSLATAAPQPSPSASAAGAVSTAAPADRNRPPASHARAETATAASSTRATTTPTAKARPATVRARAATAKRPARYIVLPKSSIQLAAMYRRKAGKPARTGSHLKGAHFRIPPSDVKRLLRTSWRAFGYRDTALERRVARNYKQIRRESTRRPAVMQGFIGDVNDHKPAGGLLQFVKPTFRHWQVGGRGDRFNPLDNILAAVNAQAHGGNAVLDGRSGWSPSPRRNPLQGRDAVRVVAA